MNKRLLPFCTLAIIAVVLSAPFVSADEPVQQQAVQVPGNPLAEPDDQSPTFQSKVITTADELIQSLETPAGPFMRSKLPPTEVKKAAAILRKKFPFESIKPRLEYEREQFPEETAAPADEETPGVLNRRAFFNTRGDALRLLHSNEVSDFINRNGFGFSRIPAPSPSNLNLPEAKPIPLARVNVSADLARESTVTLPADAKALAIVRRGPAMPPLTRLKNTADSAALYFASPWNGGYVKDRDHVAGFRSHAMQYMPTINPAEPPPATPDEAAPQPKDTSTWKTTNLELVSLLKHEKPAVYMSDHLPMMDELKKAKVRPLDRFEISALAKLKAGDEIVHEASTNRIRMLGAVRSTKQCNECHYAPAGTLLGAFSYEFIRTPQLKPAPAKPAF